jgi:hypothetical protein
MRIEGRELKPYTEPVLSNELQEGRTYFSLTYSDEDMLIPVLTPLVFVGRNLADGHAGVYFQDIDSYRQGIRFDSADEEHSATFEVCLENEINHIFTYEHALDELLNCSLRRKSAEV